MNHGLFHPIHGCHKPPMLPILSMTGPGRPCTKWEESQQDPAPPSFLWHLHQLQLGCPHACSGWNPGSPARRSCDVPAAHSEAGSLAGRPLPPELSLRPLVLPQISHPFARMVETVLPNRFESTTCQRRASGKIPEIWERFLIFIVKLGKL